MFRIDRRLDSNNGRANLVDSIPLVFPHVLLENANSRLGVGVYVSNFDKETKFWTRR